MYNLQVLCSSIMLDCASERNIRHTIFKRGFKLHTYWYVVLAFDILARILGQGHAWGRPTLWSQKCGLMPCKAAMAVYGIVCPCYPI